MTQESPYHWSYPNTYLMDWIDSLSPFEKWWRNFSTKRHPPYIPKTHYVTIEESFRMTSRGRKIPFYVATIAADHTESTETVVFEPGTPRPPAFFYPATETYVPPKVLTEKVRKAEFLHTTVLLALWDIENKNRPRAEPPPPPTIRFN